MNREVEASLDSIAAVWCVLLGDHDGLEAILAAVNTVEYGRSVIHVLATALGYELATIHRDHAETILAASRRTALAMERGEDPPDVFDT